MTRKHVKVEPLRWYYWCDRLGLLVWQDMPSGDKGIDGGKPDLVRTPESARQYEVVFQQNGQQTIIKQATQVDPEFFKKYPMTTIGSVEELNSLGRLIFSSSLHIVSSGALSTLFGRRPNHLSPTCPQVC